jgi:hypothetical protein
MLLEHLYRISLERPDRWAMFVGLPANTMWLLDVRVDLLASYIMGLREAYRLAGIPQPDTDDFFEWLIKEKEEFPPVGWSTKYLNDCEGDHLLAISKFWGFLHEYLLGKKPDWFVRLNAEPLPSQIKNMLGETRDVDIRNPEHVRLVTESSEGRA